MAKILVKIFQVFLPDFLYFFSTYLDPAGQVVVVFRLIPLGGDEENCHTFLTVLGRLSGELVIPSHYFVRNCEADWLAGAFARQTLFIFLKCQIDF